jgi:hypothetical protein
MWGGRKKSSKIDIACTAMIHGAKRENSSRKSSINHRSQVSWKEITPRRVKASHGYSRRKFSAVSKIQFNYAYSRRKLGSSRFFQHTLVDTISERVPWRDLLNSRCRPISIQSYDASPRQGKEKSIKMPDFVCTYMWCEDYSRRQINQKQYASANYKDFLDNSEKNTSTTRRIVRITRRKIFQHLVFNIVDCDLPCSGACHRAFAQTIGNARGLDINSPLSAEAHTQDLRFRRHQQHGDPNSARGLDNNFASDRGCDSTTTTRLPLHHWLRSRRPHRTR